MIPIGYLLGIIFIQKQNEMGHFGKQSTHANAGSIGISLLLNLNISTSQSIRG
jgi:hypothetical protein